MEIITGVERRRRRQPDEKLRIVAETEALVRVLPKLPSGRRQPRLAVELAQTSTTMRV